MSKRTIPAAKFKVGQKVMISLSGEEAVINQLPRWNGGTWMYSFQDKDVSCSEIYLSLAEANQ